MEMMEFTGNSQDNEKRRARVMHRVVLPAAYRDVVCNFEEKLQLVALIKLGSVGLYSRQHI